MKPIFETAARTRALIDFFCSMKLSEQISYEKISAVLKFNVTPASSASARKIADRDHKTFIAIIRGYGFFRGTHEDMVRSGPGFLLRIRKSSRRLADRMERALKGNLTQEMYQAASEMFSRAKIIESTSEKPKVFSNRKTK